MSKILGFSSVFNSGIFLRILTGVNTLERILGIVIENEELDLENVDSVGGLVLTKLRDIPEPNQIVSFDGFDITVTEIEGARIQWVKVCRKPTAT